jgi:hypothetical protein
MMTKYADDVYQWMLERVSDGKHGDTTEDDKMGGS